MKPLHQLTATEIIRTIVAGRTVAVAEDGLAHIDAVCGGRSAGRIERNRQCNILRDPDDMPCALNDLAVVRGAAWSAGWCATGRTPQ